MVPRVRAYITIVAAAVCCTSCNSDGCFAAPDGIMEPTVWVAESGLPWMKVEEDGSAWVYNCMTEAHVDRAEIDNGEIDWVVDWERTSAGGEPGYAGPGAITGDICGDAATLLLQTASSRAHLFTRDDAAVTVTCD